jgi:hypothetical protein
MDLNPGALFQSTRPPSALNQMLWDRATVFIKERVQKLINESDDDLEKHHVLQIRALLRDVDNKRAAFNDNKRRLLDELRSTLTLLRDDADSIGETMATLESMTPTWLSAIPSASTLAIRPPTPSTLGSLSQELMFNMPGIPHNLFAAQLSNLPTAELATPIMHSSFPIIGQHTTAVPRQHSSPETKCKRAGSPSCQHLNQGGPSKRAKLEHAEASRGSTRCLGAACN